MNAHLPAGALVPLVTRHTDIAIAAPLRGTTTLPPVAWERIGQRAPVRIAPGARAPDDPLPRADIVVITWTSAEWFALDHVFVDSAHTGDYNDYAWKQAWLPYTRGASPYAADAKSGALWGLFQMVRIVDRSGRPWNVLLFKSNAHLAHSPWLDGLSAMLRCIVEDARPDRIYTIGTAAARATISASATRCSRTRRCSSCNARRTRRAPRAATCIAARRGIRRPRSSAKSKASCCSG